MTKKAQAEADTLGSLCDLLTLLGQKKAAKRKEVEAIEAEENAVEIRLINAMKAAGTDIARSKTMTASLGKRSRYKILDFAKVASFALRKKRVDIFEKRLHQGAIQEIIDSGVKEIPGVHKDEFDTLSLRKRAQDE